MCRFIWFCVCILFGLSTEIVCAQPEWKDCNDKVRAGCYVLLSEASLNDKEKYLRRFFIYPKYSKLTPNETDVFLKVLGEVDVQENKEYVGDLYSDYVIQLFKYERWFLFDRYRMIGACNDYAANKNVKLQTPFTIYDANQCIVNIELNEDFEVLFVKNGEY